MKQNGEDAKSVKAGTYTLKVEDKADIHNFHLIGPGVDNDSDVRVVRRRQDGDGDPEAGTYTYQCDPHASSGMKGTFTVT